MGFVALAFIAWSLQNHSYHVLLFGFCKNAGHAAIQSLEGA